MNQNERDSKNHVRTWFTVVVVLAIGIAIGIFFSAEAGISASGGLLFLLVLACPLIMIFMMRGSRDDSTKDDQQK